MAEAEKDSHEIRYRLHERPRALRAMYEKSSDDEQDYEEVEDVASDAFDAEDNSDFDAEQALGEEEESDDSNEQVGSTAGPSAADSEKRRGRPVRGKNNFKWYKNAPKSREQRSLPPFLPSGKDAAKNVQTPLEAWSLMFNDNMLETIVLHTNEEIDRKLLALPPATFSHRTDLFELKAFIGLLYFGGIQKNNHSRTDELWNPTFGYNLYRAVMSEHRFAFLSACLRFDDKNTRREREQQHGLAPIKELWDSFIKNCKFFYSPSAFVTIDKQLLPFRGRFKSRVYDAKKPDKYGIKIVMCNDVQTSYMINAEPYVGKIVTNQAMPTYYAEKLTETMHGTARNVTCDNWFTSVNLVKEMEEKYSISVVGALRKNKPEVPRSFVSTASAGTSRFAYADGITLVSYCPKKNKVVLLLSTYHKCGKIDVETQKPEAVVFYNKTKGGTDTFDMMCKNFSVARITKRWPLRLFYGMLDQAGVNAAVLYTLKKNNEPLSRREFLKMLCSDLIKPLLRIRLEKPNLSLSLKFLIREVLGEETAHSPAASDKLEKRKRCKLCPSKDDRKTSYCCTLCRIPVCENHRLVVCLNCAPDM
ncbi:uncharacterized protein LOC117179985 [Belonocnema kinseyi]|uniref:uncharacterized protein LOC117179985 n=1 Tax=Belonocnema kinseyi TaxID=2817044 RepID=UPI00143D92E1|nr:uncharacterized protein LOC117179985 [Belonocnema kinseyi]XP_033228147.1 uncharacterized protein LOC117179985 [Belonocnema kinseyi]